MVSRRSPSPRGITSKTSPTSLTMPVNMRFLQCRHEVAGRQKIDYQPVESRWVLETTGVTGSGQDFVNGSRNEAGGALAGRQRMVERAIDHEHRDFEVRKAR